MGVVVAVLRGDVVLQVKALDAVLREDPLRHVKVGKEEDVGGLEGLADGHVLAGEQEAVLQGLGHLVEALAVVFLGAADVEDDDGLVVIDEGHVLDLAVEDGCVVVVKEVEAEPSLALVADGIVDPDDGAVVGRLGDDVVDLQLPGAELNRGARVLVGLELDENLLVDGAGGAGVQVRELLGDDAEDAVVGLARTVKGELFDAVIEAPVVSALTLAGVEGDPLAGCPGTLDEGGVLRLEGVLLGHVGPLRVGDEVVPCVVREGEPAAEHGGADGTLQLEEALEVGRAVLGDLQGALEVDDFDLVSSAVAWLAVDLDALGRTVDEPEGEHIEVLELIAEVDSGDVAVARRHGS